MRSTVLRLLLLTLPWTAAAQTPSVPHHLPVNAVGKDGGRFAGERLATDPNQGQTMLAGTRLQGLWRSVDAGVTWNRVRTFPALPLNNIGLTFVAFDKRSGQPGQPTPVIFVGVADPVLNLLRSSDAGKTWKPVAGGPVGVFPTEGVFAADGTLHLSYGDAPGSKGHGAMWELTPQTGKWRNSEPENLKTGTSR